MRSILILFAFIAMFVVFNRAQPHPQILDDSPDIIVDPDFKEDIHRYKRATCDLLSGFGVGNSACAAGCIARGFKGGWCNSQAVCNCRR